MTPNPQNIGAAPEEYPIRALVRAERGVIAYPDVPKASIIQVRGAQGGGFESFDKEEPDDPYFWLARDLILNPSEAQIAEERAKAGLPSQEGEALPEAKPKGPSPSEVPQPGEGVDLERAEFFIQLLRDGNWRETAGYMQGLIAEVRRLRSSQEVLRSALDGLYGKGWTQEAIEAARAALGKAGA